MNTSNTSQKLILVVEDDDGNRKLISELLLFQGYETVEAANGKQALLRLKDEAVDLILMDISLPDTSGLTLMKKIRADKRFAKLPIIALTAHVRPADAAAAIDAGASSHIPKPVQIQQLLSEIHRSL